MVGYNLYFESKKPTSNVLVCENSNLIRISRFEGEHNWNPTIKSETHLNTKLYIGKYVSVGIKTTFLLGGNHNYKRITTWLPFDMNYDLSNSLLSNGDIHIGHDVWIGEGATIMSGISIGTGAVIATNAVVTKNVDPYTIIGGNPAKPIKKRFSDDNIEFLLNSKWWDIDPEIIKNNQSIIFSEDFEKFKQFILNIK